LKVESCDVGGVGDSAFERISHIKILRETYSLKRETSTKPLKLRKRAVHSNPLTFEFNCSPNSPWKFSGVDEKYIYCTNFIESFWCNVVFPIISK
jgi:hypothetical protein